MTAILSGVICPVRTAARNSGFLESFRFEYRLLIRVLYLDSVFLNSPYIRKAWVKENRLFLKQLASPRLIEY